MNLPITVGVSPTLHIRGILASRDIKKGEIIERCPLILYPIHQDSSLDRTVLGKYYFEWTKGYSCIVLGYGSLMNHSYTPNAKYTHDYKQKVIVFRAIKNIKKGEEVFVNYNWDPKDGTPIESHLIDYNKNILT
jgi:uncharacterized protein